MLDENKEFEKLCFKNWKVQKNSKKNLKYVHAINDILKKRGISERISIEDIFTINYKNKKILNTSPFSEYNEKLRDILENYIWYKVQENTYLYHFTTQDNAEKIVSSNILRQYNILKNHNEGEIKDFFNYYGVKNYFEEHYNDKFYTSFTTKIPDTINRISAFKCFTGISGARLKFKVNKKDDFFRYIDYNTEKLSILKDLKEELKKYNVDFNISGITTRLAGFFVNDKYVNESEVRYYRHEKNKNLFKNDGKYSFVELPFNSISNCNQNTLISLVEVIYEKDGNKIFDI